MSRPGDDNGGGERIEVWVEDAGEGGPGRSETADRRPWRAVGLVLLGGMVGVLATLAATKDDHGAESPGTASAITSITSISSIASETSTSPVSIVPVVTSRTTTSTTVSLPVLPFGEPTGIVVYLTPPGAPTAVIAYDIDSAVAHRLELGTDVGWFLRTVEFDDGVAVDAGEVMSVVDGAVTPLGGGGGDNDYNTAPAGRVAAGPDGRVWLRQFDPDVIALVDAAGQPFGNELSLPRGSDLYGSMADGRPVVRGADGQLFVIGLDGQRTLLSPNALSPVQAGRFAEVRCDESQQCSLIAHIDDREFDLGSPIDQTGQRRLVRFEPGGSMVAVVDGDDLTLLDPVAGRLVLDVHLDIGLFPSDAPPLLFLPNHLGIVAATQEGVQLFDLSGASVAVISADSGSVPGPLLLGVGTATPWSSS